MRTFFDTTVLVAALSSNHLHYPLAAPWLRRALSGEFAWFVSTHTLAECYSTLTAKSTNFSIPPALAARMIRQNITSQSVTIVDLNAADYETAIGQVAAAGLFSGVIYDALLITAARKINVERLLTLNLKHFLQVWPGGTGIITSP